MIDEQLQKLYLKLGLELPSHEEHGVFDPEKHGRVQTSDWKMVAPGTLEAHTAEGPLTVRVPMDLICTGTDEKGLPILQKIKL